MSSSNVLDMGNQIYESPNFRIAEVLILKGWKGDRINLFFAMHLFCYKFTLHLSPNSMLYKKEKDVFLNLGLKFEQRDTFVHSVVTV